MSSVGNDSPAKILQKTRGDVTLAGKIGSRKNISGYPGMAEGIFSESKGQGDSGGFPQNFPENFPAVTYGEQDGTTPIDIDLKKFFSHVTKVKLTGDMEFTISNPPGVSKAMMFFVEIELGGTQYDVTWPAAVKGNPQPTINSKTLIMLYTDDQGATFHSQIWGASGSGGITDPIIQGYDTVSPVTLPSKTNIDASSKNIHIITLDKNIEIDIINPPASGKFELIHLIIIQNGTGNFTVAWPAEVQGTPAIDLTPTNFTDVSMYSYDEGAKWHYRSTKGGSIGNVSDWANHQAVSNIDANDKDIIKVANIDLDGIAATIEGIVNLDLFQLNQSINSLAAGVSYQSAAQQYHKMIVGGVPVATFEETTPANYLATIDAIMNLVDNEINSVKQIAFSGNEVLGSAESGIGMNDTENAMKYNVALTSYVHKFTAADELLASISRIGSNEGQLSIEAVVAEILQTNDQLYFADASTDPTINGQMRRNGTDVKVFSGGSLRNLSNIGGGGYTANRAMISDVSGDLIASAITSAELLNALTGYPVGDSVDTRLDAVEPLLDLIEELSGDTVLARSSGEIVSKIGSTEELRVASGNVFVKNKLWVDGDMELGTSESDSLEIDALIESALKIATGIGTKIAEIKANDLTVDELEIELQANKDFILSLSGTTKQHYDASANQMSFDGCQTLLSAERLNIPEVTVNPPTPSSGEITVFAISSGGTKEVRAKNSNGDVITLGAFP